MLCFGTDIVENQKVGRVRPEYAKRGNSPPWPDYTDWKIISAGKEVHDFGSERTCFVHGVLGIH
jgi:hypothetical protein